MIVAGTTLKELAQTTIAQRKTTLERLAREADMSWSQFSTVVNGGLSEGTRFGTIKKLAKVLGKSPSELIRLVGEE